MARIPGGHRLVLGGFSAHSYFNVLSNVVVSRCGTRCDWAGLVFMQRRNVPSGNSVPPLGGHRPEPRQACMSFLLVTTCHPILPAIPQLERRTLAGGGVGAC